MSLFPIFLKLTGRPCIVVGAGNLAESKIESLLKQNISSARYFVGYSGWTSGQLEAEMELNSWVIADALPGHVFEDPANLWAVLVRQRLLSPWMDPSQIPDDPSVN